MIGILVLSAVSLFIGVGVGSVCIKALGNGVFSFLVAAVVTVGLILAIMEVAG